MSAARFTVIIGTPEQLASSANAEFVRRIEHGGQSRVHAVDDAFVLYASPTTECVIDVSGSTVVIGTLFNGDQQVTEMPVALDDQATERLISDFWGGYVAVRRLLKGVEVFRDPSGAVPCYHFQLAGARIVTSDIAGAMSAAAIHPRLDWTIIQQALVYRDLRPAHTALVGIDELHPGNAALIDRASIQIRAVWSPWMFTDASDEVTDRDTAIGMIGGAVRRCVAAWGNQFERMLIEVSGGLDSSIIAAVLSCEDRTISAISFGPAPGDPNEIPYARAVAEMLHFPMSVRHLDALEIDLRRSNARFLPRPCARSFTQGMDKTRQSIAREAGAQAIFSGGGGDNVFCNLQSALPAVDRLRRGPQPSVLETIGDIAAITQTNVWQVLAQTLRRSWRPRPANYWPRRSQYIAKALIEALPFPESHPWLISPRETLPGKRAHVMTLIGIQNHLEARAASGDVPIISPLLSQPVMEACLKVVTWQWCSGGNNRAVAREAFRNDLPAAVINRKSKGAFDGFCASIIQTNFALIREMLLDGSLAAHNLLDLGEIEADLTRASVNGESGARLLGLLDTEAWVRSWEDSSSGGGQG